MQSCAQGHALVLGPGCWGKMGCEGRWGSHTPRRTGLVLTALKAARLFSASSFSWISSCSLWAKRGGQGHVEGAPSPVSDVPP